MQRHRWQASTAPRTRQAIRQTYKQGELQALLKTLAADRSPLGLRDRAVVCVLQDTGAQASELCALTFADIQADTVLLRRTKSGCVWPSWAGAPSRPLPLPCPGRCGGHSVQALFVTQDDRPYEQKRAQAHAGAATAAWRLVGLLDVAGVCPSRRGRPARDGTAVWRGGPTVVESRSRIRETNR